MNLPYILKLNPFFVILSIFFVVLLPFVLWASFFHIEQISKGTGVIIAASKKQEIQSFQDGQVSIFVSEGDVVKKGDLIAKIDDKDFLLDFEAVKSKLISTEASINRLEAELTNSDIVFSSRVSAFPSIMSLETALYKKRLTGLNNEIEGLSKLLVLAKEELNLMKPLASTGDIGKVDLLRLQRQVSDLEYQIINKKNKFFEDTQSDLLKNKQELLVLEEEFKNKQSSLNKTQIFSPVNGFVNNKLITTKEAKVRTGDVLLEIIPEEDLFFEGRIKPIDISFVKPNQKVLLKIDTYDFSIFGGVPGLLSFVGSDVLYDKIKNEYYFKVLVKVNKNSFTKIGKSVFLSPGMAGEVDIITGDRTVISYLLKPIVKTLDSSLSER